MKKMKNAIIIFILFSTITIFSNGCMLPFFGNEAPIIQSSPPETVKLGNTYSYQVEATDDNNTDLKYSLAIFPEGMTVNPSTGIITWIPTESQLGENEVSLKVSDGWMSSTQDFTVEVKMVVLSSISVNPNSMEIIRPGITSEGTIFFEAEKIPYQHLLTDIQKNKIEQIKLLHLLLNLEGKKYLFFSCFDTLNNQEQAPASLLLQLYRLSHQNWEISYEEFSNSLGEMKKLIPVDKTEFLDEGGVFLYFSNKEKRDMQPFLQKKYGDYVEGIKADTQRKIGGFNSYNGKVNVTAQKIDPRQNRGIVISSSKLERIAICPYLYFLNDILKVKKPEEMEYEPVQWMNPLERGLLLHQIYEIFYRRLIENSQVAFEPPSYAKHWQVLEKIAEECLEEKRKYLAPPGELIYQAEKREILESCKIFLTGEEKYYKGQVPQYFELAFGTRDNEHEVLGKVRSVELTTPSGEKISFQGKIDRIDKMSDGTYRIIDYKTGGSVNYKRDKPYRHGEQLQHALYAVSLKRILEKKLLVKNVTISESGYYFPTEYGRGNLILYKQKNANKVLEIVEILLNIISQGVFPMTQKPEHFMCRDYQDIMEQNEIISVNGKAGEKYEGEVAFDNLRRLKQFE